MIDRGAFIGAVVIGLIVTPLSARSQEPGRVWRIGFVEAGAPAANQHFLDAFKRGLREGGYVEGRNVVIVDRWADGHVDRFPALLDELVGLKVDVLVVASTAGAVAAKPRVTTIPVVFVGVQDPLGTGLVSNLGRPGGNLTGFAQAEEDGLVGKRLELFKEVMPSLARLALLWNPSAAGVALRLRDAQAAAATFGVTLRPFEVRDAKDLEGLFAAMTKDRVPALMVLADPLTVRNRQRIVDLAARARLPAIYPFLEFARVGGLMAYGPSIPELFRRAAMYVDKILKGTHPADLPVEQPTKLELVVNVRTARALGLTLPPSLLTRADEVIQ